MREESSRRAFAPYAPELVSGLSLAVAVPSLIGLVLEPAVFGLPLLAEPLLLVPGLILVATGFVVAFAGVLTLAREVGPEFSTSPPRLCKTGPYAYVRNPGYLGGILVTIGLASVLFSPGALIVAGLIWARLHLVVVRVEEPMLSRKFGEEYEVYRRHTGRWLPRLRRL
ncbi:MAG: isoprenylcysteine carboxylmethyltransferase family protein [Thermoplasmata archaeon]